MSIQTLWVETYRPKTLKECVLPKRIEDLVASFLRKKDVPNLLFHGKAGTAKTTTARVIASELGADTLYINMSDETGKAEVLEKVVPFASSVSMGNRDVPKIVIGDECDRLSPQAQDSLKAYIEQFSQNCRFIFIANTPSRIIPPIKSRVTEVCFDIRGEERSSLMMKFFTRVRGILDENGVAYEPKPLGMLVANLFPDYRQIMITLQNYAGMNKKIDEGILTVASDEIAPTLYGFIEGKNFNNARKWLRENFYTPDDIINSLYEGLPKYVSMEKQPEFILILSEYAYKASFVANAELNMMAMLTELMATGGGKR